MLPSGDLGLNLKTHKDHEKGWQKILKQMIIEKKKISRSIYIRQKKNLTMIKKARESLYNDKWGYQARDITNVNIYIPNIEGI